MQKDEQRGWNSKYPVSDAGQQFIFACRRTASRLDLTEAEKFSTHAGAVVPEDMGASDTPVTNVIASGIEAAVFDQVDDAQSA